MIQINLIPESLREARRHRRLIARWICGGVVYAGLLLIGCMTARSIYMINSHSLDQEMSETVHRITAADQSARALKAQLADLQERSQTARAIAEQPDWSILLTAIADRMGDDLVLRELRIEPSTDASTAKTITTDPLAAQQKYKLVIRGLGRSSDVVAKFVSYLEDANFFDEVKLTHTGREPFLTGMAESFDLECSFGSAPMAQAEPGRRK